MPSKWEWECSGVEFFVFRRILCNNFFVHFGALPTPLFSLALNLWVAPIFVRLWKYVFERPTICCNCGEWKIDFVAFKQTQKKENNTSSQFCSDCEGAYNWTYSPELRQAKFYLLRQPSVAGVRELQLPESTRWVQEFMNLIAKIHEGDPPSWILAPS